MNMRSNSDDSGGSKRSFTGNARREQITRAAIETLAESGFAAASLSLIAERVGVSKGVLSYHFSDKADLVREVVRSVLGDAGSWMTPRIEGASSYREALHRYISANVSFLGTHRIDILALTEVIANARATPGVPEIFGESQREAVDALQKLFTDGQRAGEFGEVPASILARALRATIDSVSEQLRADTSYDLVAFEQQLTALFDSATSPTTSTSKKDVN
jgi:TetR/AcrR family fatty acid metabolism transcriptional regulator